MTEELRRQWGTNIKLGRRALGMRQEDLADALGVRQSNVSRWEAAKTGPRDDMKARIAAVLHQDVRQLFPLFAKVA